LAHGIGRRSSGFVALKNAKASWSGARHTCINAPIGSHKCCAHGLNLWEKRHRRRHQVVAVLAHEFEESGGIS
jgi:hypothetical protein